jgi:hypothetical protein
MRVACEIEYTTLLGESESGDEIEIDGVTAACPRCDHTTEAYGTGGASIRRCLATLREQCPRRERNFYFDEEGEDR